MVAKCVIGACIAILCAVPVLGEEGNVAAGVKMAKFVEPSPTLPNPAPPPLTAARRRLRRALPGRTHRRTA